MAAKSKQHENEPPPQAEPGDQGTAPGTQGEPPVGGEQKPPGSDQELIERGSYRGQPTMPLTDAERAAAQKQAGNAAAPLNAPGGRVAGEPMIGHHLAVGAILDSRHVGIVDEDGNKVDLASVLVKDSESASNRRASKRIYEETTLPGTDRTSRKLLFGENAEVSGAVYDEIMETVESTKSSREQQKQ